jgi:hypothetical protein
MGTNPEPVNPADGPLNIRTKLDSTPKCGNGHECYPPKDPLWSCTRPDGKEVDLGRNGHDFYDCYNPIIHVHDTVPITCCANTGLNGDCFTWHAEASDQANPSGSPDVSASPGPSSSVSPSAAPIACAPVQQTVETNQVAHLEASGGGTYEWNVGGGALVEDNGSSIGVKFGVSGTKTVRVTSGGATASCTVTVVIPEPTPTPSASLSATPSPGGTYYPPASSTPTPTGGYVTPLVSNGVTITPAPGADTDGDGIADRTECPDANRCPDSNGDGVADWQDPAIGNRVGRVLSVSEVATGPGEATLLALIISALVSLLYVTYTHSPLALRREVEDISKDQGPLDFRS